MNIPSTFKTTGRATALGALALTALGTVAAFAQEAAAPAAAPATPAPTLDTGNTAWMLTSTALVLMMTIPGLALFYGGMVRKKNVLATIMQSFAITCLVTVLWFMFGYSLAFSDGGSTNAYVGGFSKFFHHGITTATLWLPGVANIPEFVFSMFQLTFAIITPALIAGAFAERMKFSALLIFMGLWLVFVYAPIAHWVWGGGFLGSAGVLDFAGGTVVHINAGVAGLVCALVLGKREGYGTANMAPHNLVYSVIGASLLWVGWFGFNAGSELAADGLAGAAMLNTQVATAAAALAWMFAEWIIAKKPSVLGIISGAVAGLVAVTPASGFVNPTGAFIIGIVAGVVCYISAVKVKHMLGYDDSLDAFGVHGVGGIIGALLTGALADPEINALGKGASVGTQIYGIVFTILWTAIATFVILYIVKALVGLRPSSQEEIEGLDISQHGEVVP
ncbi:MAG: ammonium transporter [Mesorhizobium sp.]|uniref:ammonium transporter n=1 Tax=unclassified Mesorhizobium TaxID=325217 RepID=UPI000F759CE1|nr:MULTISPECIES: ammonium transporter [unclassified Mesorhizobium]AZO50050.1 ammonium transporter [Mesorhizobium sp. M4B.F.Ca.ET.058.02.1.1]RVC46278.1 ammonium transporter [Mesorhizobium sp. M4A.F.Ca.ET.090.04.2.1]RVC80548.1 ammonium transporter [Mesorhizobium sp. M4A.F.Ca.ET.022.05.2.1]RWC51160.1 MAG: ammonium transporter [Mesorhizobium sp.]RWD06324.1 MAG: ammonium transporter [Mesorhizobium sp.]